MSITIHAIHIVYLFPRDSGVLALARRAAEACFLLRVLSESNLPRLASRCSEGTRSRLLGLKFRDLVTGAEGEAVAAQLISTLVGQHMTSGGGRTEDLASLLQVWLWEGVVWDIDVYKRTLMCLRDICV